MSQEECLEILRKCVEKSPIPGIQKSTLQNITKVATESLIFFCLTFFLSFFFFLYLFFPLLFSIFFVLLIDLIKKIIGNFREKMVILTFGSPCV